MPSVNPHEINFKGAVLLWHWKGRKEEKGTHSVFQLWLCPLASLWSFSLWFIIIRLHPTWDSNHWRSLSL